MPEVSNKKNFGELKTIKDENRHTTYDIAPFTKFLPSTVFALAITNMVLTPSNKKATLVNRYTKFTEKNRSLRMCSKFLIKKPERPQQHTSKLAYVTILLHSGWAFSYHTQRCIKNPIKHLTRIWMGGRVGGFVD